MLSRQYFKIASCSITLMRNRCFLCNFNSFRFTRPLISTVRYKHTEKMTKRDLPKISRFGPHEINLSTTMSAISSETVLEKFIAAVNTDIYQKNRVYKNDFMRVLAKVKEINFCTRKQGLLLIRCCGELLPDEPAPVRMSLVEQVWTTITPHTQFDVDHYNELLKVYIANQRTLNANSFIQRMSPIPPNITTYELILKVLGEAGDLNQATEVLFNMKVRGFPANENIFNSLIVCQGKSGNLKNIQEVLSMMKSLKINPTLDTYTAMARALVWNKKAHEMLDTMKDANRAGFEFQEYHIMEIVKTCAAVDMYESIPRVLSFLPDETLKTPSISAYMQSVTTQLVFQNHPIAALEIYKCLPLPSFGPKDDKGLHGRSLVRDCVKACIPSSIIGFVTQELMSSGRNPIALQNAAEAALQLGRVPLALDIFTRMKMLGIPIRPHYFWPVFLHNSKCYGEKGIMNTLTIMEQMDVKPDYDTLMEYIMPFVSFTSPQNLMKKFIETGLPVSTVLTPMMVTLFNAGQVRGGSEICELFHGKVDAEKLLKPLIKGYIMSADVKSTIHALEDINNKASDRNKDWIGRFLCKFMQHKRVNEDVTDLFNFVKALHKSSVKISTVAADYCLSRIPSISNPKYSEETLRNYITQLVDDQITDDGDLFDQQIPHPKQMDEESLRAHLIELEAKNMNTRGVLRKLLQHYCKEGNVQAAKEIATKCRKEGVYLSAGMKAAIFDLHVKLGELEAAEMAIADLNKTSPNFKMDEFKIIDFATLMVYKKQIPKAMDVIRQHSKRRKIMGGRSIVMNCWRLLDATAGEGDHNDVRNMFDLLTKLNYCKPSNVLLGPFIRVHLKNNDLEEAVKQFVQLSKKYGTTPLKHELLCKILYDMGDGKSEEIFMTIEKTNGRYNKLVQTILESDMKVHGPGDVQLTLIAALADVNYKKTLRKLFLDPSVKFHPDALRRRCERFADEKKVKALENIAECARDLRHVNTEEIYDLILDVHMRNDNFQAARALWVRLQEANITPSRKFVENLCGMYKSSNRDVPTDLAILIEKPAKKASKT